MRWDTSRVQPFWGYNLARTGEEACDEMHDMIDQLGEYTCMITVTSAFSEHVGRVLVGGSILLPSLPWTRFDNPDWAKKRSSLSLLQTTPIHMSTKLNLSASHEAPLVECRTVTKVPMRSLCL